MFTQRDFEQFEQEAEQERQGNLLVLHRIIDFDPRNPEQIGREIARKVMSGECEFGGINLLEEVIDWIIFRENEGYIPDTSSIKADVLTGMKEVGKDQPAGSRVQRLIRSIETQ